MNNEMRATCLASCLCSLLMSGCVAYSDRVSYRFDTSAAGWQCSVSAGSCTYSCASGTVRVSEPSSVSSTEGVLVPMYRLPSQGYRVQMRIDDNVMGAAKCNQDGLRLVGDDQVFIAPKDASSRYYNNPSGFSGFYLCEFVFPVELVTRSMYTLKFGEGSFSCPIPSIHVNREESGGFELRQLQ